MDPTQPADDSASPTHGLSQRTETYLRAVNQFALRLIEITSVEDLVWHVAEEVVGQLDFVDCVVYLLDKERKVLVQRAAIGDKSPGKRIILNRLEIPVGTGITGTVAATCEPMLLDCTRDDPRYLPDMAVNCSELCVPMVYDGELLGVIDSESPEPGYFNQQHQEILTTIAAMASARIGQCRVQDHIEAQARIIEQVSEAVFLVNQQGFIRACNSGAEQMLGRTRETLRGANLRDLLGADVDASALSDEIDAAIQKSGRWQGRISFGNGEQEALIAELSVTTYDRPGAEEPTNVYVARDISQQVEADRLQRELQQAQKMESLGHLAGGIAHDFNNLLGIITGYTDLAQRRLNTSSDPRLQKYLTQIDSASQRATHLVAQMLTFSRHGELERRSLQLEQLVREDVKLIRATLPSSIELVTEIEAGLPDVLVEPTQINQILMNLSVNGRDAMGGVGTLTIGVGWARDMNTVSLVSHKPVLGDWLELRVSDTGTGIKPEQIHRIFNPFFTTKEVGKGTGLGLSVIYKIVSEYDGHILVDSEPGHGTTFRLLLAPVETHHTTAAVASIQAGAAPPRGAGQRIMVVDDEASLGEMVAQTLADAGYYPLWVSDSRQALQQLSADPDQFDLVITDQTMPRTTGLELIAAMRELPRRIPAILCSGYSDKIDASRASARGIPYLTKPVSADALLRCVANQLQTSDD